jgi:ribosomal protein L17
LIEKQGFNAVRSDNSTRQHDPVAKHQINHRVSFTTLFSIKRKKTCLTISALQRLIIDKMITINHQEDAWERRQLLIDIDFLLKQ